MTPLSGAVCAMTMPGTTPGSASAAARSALRGGPLAGPAALCPRGVPPAPPRQRAGRIEDHRECRRILGEEPLGVGALLVDIDGDGDEPAAGVALVQLVHPWERAAAGTTPRRPEIDIDDLAGEARKRDGVAGGGRQRERRGRPADPRRGA